MQSAQSGSSCGARRKENALTCSFDGQKAIPDAGIEDRRVASVSVDRFDLGPSNDISTIGQYDPISGNKGYATPRNSAYRVINITAVHYILLQQQYDGEIILAATGLLIQYPALQATNQAVPENANKGFFVVKSRIEWFHMGRSAESSE